MTEELKIEEPVMVESAVNTLPPFETLVAVRPALPPFEQLTQIVKPHPTVAIDAQAVTAPQLGVEDRAVTPAIVKTVTTTLPVEEPVQVETVPQSSWPFPVGRREDSSQAVRVKNRNPRPRTAESLASFRAKHGAGHALFYRYKRMPDPVYPTLAGPKGGACVLINMLNNDIFTFSFSVCSPVDAFIKDEARRICQHRFDDGETITLRNRDENLSCFENILYGLYNYENGFTDEKLQSLYFNSSVSANKHNLLLLKNAIENYITVGF